MPRLSAVGIPALPRKRWPKAKGGEDVNLCVTIPNLEAVELSGIVTGIPSALGKGLLSLRYAVPIERSSPSARR